MMPFETISLGELIRALEERPASDLVRFDFCNFVPSGINSYRGFYDHLAIGYSDKPYATVHELLDALRAAIGKEFTGYKGGSFRMHEETPVWVDLCGDCTSTAIVGINGTDYDITYLETRHVEV